MKLQQSPLTLLELWNAAPWTEGVSAKIIFRLRSEHEIKSTHPELECKEIQNACLACDQLTTGVDFRKMSKLHVNQALTSRIIRMASESTMGSLCLQRHRVTGLAQILSHPQPTQTIGWATVPPQPTTPSFPSNFFLNCPAPPPPLLSF